MPDRSPAREETASTRKSNDEIGLEIIAKLATVLEVEPAELLKMAAEDKREN
jgi:DNA-binding Xre family transcriptional regulator